jgi:hypothetical protein
MHFLDPDFNNSMEKSSTTAQPACKNDKTRIESRAEHCAQQCVGKSSARTRFSRSQFLQK